MVGRAKGSSFVLWFLISGAIPFFGLLAAVFYRSDNHELRRLCPVCGSVLKLHDAVCMACGTELTFPDQAIASKAQMRQRAGTHAA